MILHSEKSSLYQTRLCMQVYVTDTNSHSSKAGTKHFSAGWNVSSQLLSTQKAFHVLPFIVKKQSTEMFQCKHERK